MEPAHRNISARHGAHLAGLVPLYLLLWQAAPLPAAPSDVRMMESRIYVSTAEATIHDLLQGIAEQAGIEVSSRVALDDPCNCVLDGVSLHRDLRSLLRNHSYTFIYTEQRRILMVHGTGSADRLSHVPETAGLRDTDALSYLGNPNATSRLKAATLLATSDDPAYLPALLGMLGDERPAVREEALYGLAELGDQEQLSPIAGALGDPEARVRKAAVEALVALGGINAAKWVRVALEDTDPQVRAAAGDALNDLREN